MISKELLSEVLGRKDISDVWIDRINKNKIGFYTQHEIENSINIYELSHKCKEWAYNHDFRLTSFKHKPFIWRSNVHTRKEMKYQVDADTEPEAIFRACELIKENK